MDMPNEHAAETASAKYEAPPVGGLLDPNEALDLHRAINERRAQVENPEILRHLRSL